MSRTPDIPQFLFHGSFWPLGLKLNPKNGLYGDHMLSVTESLNNAQYFAHLKRGILLSKPGELIIFRIDTSKLPHKLLESAIAPKEDGSKVFGIPVHPEAWIRERILFSEWNFTQVVPWLALSLEEKRYKQAYVR